MRLYHGASRNRPIIDFVKTGHNIAARQFLAELMEGCRVVGITRKDSYAIGSGRHECVTNRSKEPDEGFKPQAIRPYFDDKPTLAVEIGFSESLEQLRNDAGFWLTHTNRQVKAVISILINRNNASLHIEKWQMQSMNRPAKAQEFDIVSNNDAMFVQPEVPLVISHDLLFDVKPAHVTGTEVRIPSGCLQGFAAQYLENTRIRPQGGYSPNWKNYLTWLA